MKKDKKSTGPYLHYMNEAICKEASKRGLKEVTYNDVLREFGRGNFTHVNDENAWIPTLSESYCQAVVQMARELLDLKSKR
jgi:hypothetical protein